MKAAGKKSAEDAEVAKENKAEGAGVEQVDAHDDVASNAAEPGTPPRKKEQTKPKTQPKLKIRMSPRKKSPRAKSVKPVT